MTTVSDEAPDARRTGLARLAIGLGHGLALFALHRAGEAGVWPATLPELFGPLVLVCAYVPVLLLGSVGRLPRRELVVWAAAAAAVLAALAWHDAVQRAPGDLDSPGPFPSPVLFAAAAAALFIAHHLVLPAVRVGRLVAPFALYFDTAWKAGVQLALTVGFLGVFWILLNLGAALFQVIGLDFLQTLIRQDWFYIPVTALMFAVGVQLSDVHDALIRGVRTVGLTLLSWLLPVMTVLAVGFLAALPFTGLQLLWDTGSATALVLGAMASLIVLINAGYQDGTGETRPHLVLRWAARLAAVALVPMVAIALWGLALRVGQHGLTPERIYALACALLGAVYAGGYAFAAVRPGPWMRPLELTNVVAAVATVAVILALFSPLADPSRLSVNDQLARLARGEVTAEQFDYAFLRFESGRHGQAALARLARSDHAEVARRAREAQQAEGRWARGVRPDPADRRIDVYPEGAELPAGFLRGGASPDRRATCSAATPCSAMSADTDNDGQPEVLLAQDNTVVVFDSDGDRWSAVAQYFIPICGGEPKDAVAAMSAGLITLAPPTRMDLVFEGRHTYPAPDYQCSGGRVVQPDGSAHEPTVP